MKIKLMSDLHFEFWNTYGVPDYMLVPNADVLVLAGDIDVEFSGLVQILKQFAAVYPHVLYVPGNHEFYGSDINYLLELPKHVPSNVRLMNPGLAKIEDVAFIGAPLWTNFRQRDKFAMHAAKSMISDFRRIKDFSPEACANLFDQHLKFIELFYNSIPGKKVIITHFLPSVECISPRYRGEGLLNYYFANDLGEFISDMKDVKYWMFGHTHDSVDFMQGDVRMLCNPYGYQYRDSNPDFKEVIVEC